MVSFGGTRRGCREHDGSIAWVVLEGASLAHTLARVASRCASGCARVCPCLPVSAPAGITSIKRAFKEVRNTGAPTIDPPGPELADVVARGCHPSLQEGNLRKNTIKESNLHTS